MLVRASTKKISPPSSMKLNEMYPRPRPFQSFFSFFYFEEIINDNPQKMMVVKKIVQTLIAETIPQGCERNVTV